MDPFMPGISPADETGGLEGEAGSLIFEGSLMNRAGRIPRIDNFQAEMESCKKWSSGPRLCIQHFAGHFTGVKRLAKPEFSTGCLGGGALNRTKVVKTFLPRMDTDKHG
jgi:hypothetical protein